MPGLALFAGSAATTIFIVSQLPMLIKAWRTKDLASYSLAQIALANLGNALYTAYVISVPIGPIWALHGFNLGTTALMLFWYLRYGRPAQPAATASALNRGPTDGAVGEETASGHPRAGDDAGNGPDATATLQPPVSALSSSA